MMVDKLTKFLKKRDRKTALSILDMLEQLSRGDLSNMDVKKIRGRKNVFRIRKGRIRIVFAKRGNRIFVIRVDYRDEHTYGGI